MSVAGIDVGGTAIKAVVVDEHGREELRLRRPTPRNDTTGGAIIDAVVEIAHELAAGRRLDALGIVVPGEVDAEAGIARYSGTLGWRDVPFVERVAGQVSSIVDPRLVILRHDVMSAGVAELRLGAARGEREAAIIAVGTGIAACLVSDGHVIRGTGAAGEIGHLDIGHAEPCVCGATGCLEAMSSAGAMVRRYAAKSGEHADGALDVLTRAQAGDLVAAQVWDEAVEGLAVACTALVTLLAPALIVIGGGVSESGELLLADLRERVANRLTFQARPRFARAELGDKAGSLGAALLASDALTTRGDDD